MYFYGKALTLGDLGNISDKAVASWVHFGFGVGDDWCAVASNDGAVIIMDASRNLNDAVVMPDIEEFVLWLELVYDEKAM